MQSYLPFINAVVWFLMFAAVFRFGAVIWQTWNWTPYDTAMKDPHNHVGRAMRRSLSLFIICILWLVFAPDVG